jgi:hypothetical protein
VNNQSECNIFSYNKITSPKYSIKEEYIKKPTSIFDNTKYASKKINFKIPKQEEEPFLNTNITTKELKTEDVKKISCQLRFLSPEELRKMDEK